MMSTEEKRSLYAKWLGIVLLNTVSGCYWAICLNNSAAWVIGIVFGIATWVVLYICIDSWLIRHDLRPQSRILTVSAVVKALLQGIYVMDIWIGFFVLAALEVVGVEESTAQDTAHAYLATVGVGLVYSVIVFVMFATAILLRRYVLKRR